jgi:hypothetical protein
MPDKSKYSREVVEPLDVASAYFANLFFNKIWQRAEVLYQEGRYDSKTAAFTGVMLGFVKHSGLEKNDFLQKSISGITQTYKDAGFNTMQYSDTTTKLICALLPKDFWDELRPDSINKTLYDCLHKTTRKFVQLVASDYIDYILQHRDAHNGQRIVNVLKEEYLSLLLEYHDDIYQAIVAKKTGGAEPDTVRLQRRELQQLRAERDQYKTALQSAKRQLATGGSGGSSTALVEKMRGQMQQLIEMVHARDKVMVGLKQRYQQMQGYNKELITQINGDHKRKVGKGTASGSAPIPPLPALRPVQMPQRVQLSSSEPQSEDDELFAQVAPRQRITKKPAVVPRLDFAPSDSEPEDEYVDDNIADLLVDGTDQMTIQGGITEAMASILDTTDVDEDYEDEEDEEVVSASQTPANRRSLEDMMFGDDDDDDEEGF